MCVCVCVHLCEKWHHRKLWTREKNVKDSESTQSYQRTSRGQSYHIFATICYNSIHLFFLSFFFSLVFGKILCVIIYFLLFKAGNLNSLLVFSNSSFLDFTLPQDILGIQYTLGDSRLFQFERNLRWKEF